MSATTMLVYKDLVQQAKRLSISCMILITFSVVTGLSEGTSIGFPILTTMLVALSLSMSLGIAYDDEQGGLIFLRSLPLKPGQMVLGRYMSALMIVLILAVCIAIPLLLVGSSFMNSYEIGIALLAALCSGLLMVGFTFALFYRYGYRTVRTGFLAVFLGSMALQAGMAGLSNAGVFAGPPPPWLESLLVSLHDTVMSSWVSATLFGSVTVLLLYAGLGWWAARGLYKRDF